MFEFLIFLVYFLSKQFCDIRLSNLLFLILWQFNLNHFHIYGFDHLRNLLGNKRQRPLKKIHLMICVFIFFKMIRMVNFVILLYSDFVWIKNENSAFVVIWSAVVWRTENCYDWGMCGFTAPSVHLISVDLNLMSPNYWKIIVSFEDL